MTDSNDGVIEGQPVPNDKEEGSDEEVLEGAPVQKDDDVSKEGDDDAVIDGMPVEKPALGEDAPLLPSMEKDSGDPHLGRRCYRWSACFAYTWLFLLLAMVFWWVPYGLGATQREHVWTLWFPIALVISVLMPFVIWMHFTKKCEQKQMAYGASAFAVLLVAFAGAFCLGIAIGLITEEALRVLWGSHENDLCASISPATIPDVTTGMWADGSYVYEGHTGWVLEKNTCIVLAPVLAATLQNTTGGCSAVLGDDGTTTVRFWAYRAEAVSSSTTDCSHIAAPATKKGAIIKAADPVMALRQEHLEDWDNLKTPLDAAKNHFFTTGGTASEFVDGGHSRYVELSDDPEGAAAQGSFWPIFMFFAVPALALVVALGLHQLYKRDPKCCCFQHLGFLATDAAVFDQSMQSVHDSYCASK